MPHSTQIDAHRIWPLSREVTGRVYRSPPARTRSVTSFRFARGPLTVLKNSLRGYGTEPNDNRRTPSVTEHTHAAPVASSGRRSRTEHMAGAAIHVPPTSSSGSPPPTAPPSRPRPGRRLRATTRSMRTLVSSSSRTDGVGAHVAALLDRSASTMGRSAGPVLVFTVALVQLLLVGGARRGAGRWEASAAFRRPGPR